jgi:hypothetical protein
MRSAVAIGLLVLVAVPASAAAAPAVDPSSISRSVIVPSGATRTLTLTCPGTAVALHGAASSELGSDSIPSADPQRWTFRFTSNAGDPRRRAGAIVRCVGLRVPAGLDGVRLVVGTLRRPDVFVVAGATRRVVLTCDPGMIPTGWGIARGGAGRAIAVAAAAPTRRGFVFQLENTGDVGASATPRIRCLERTQRAEGGRTHSFASRVASFEDTASAARHLCRRGEYSVSAGVSLDLADDVVLTRATPTGERGGIWRFSGGAEATTSLVCLARRTGFR